MDMERFCDGLSHLERDVLVTKANLEFLPAVLVLVRPFGVVFSVDLLTLDLELLQEMSDFVISLSLMMRLISSINKELTHTILEFGISIVMPAHNHAGQTYSLCGSGSRYGSSSCWHISPMQSGHRGERGNRILQCCQRCCTFTSACCF